ncbi:MAG: hypothetical protein WCP06_07490 [Verrucomicrobiota bacterium]
MIRHTFLLMALGLALASGAGAATFNGNEFALAYTEAKTPAAKATVLKDAQGQPHFFRYLQIMEMQPVTEEGREGLRITAFEPSSYLDVKFTVTMPVSLSLLREEPVSKVGDAIAVTGRLTGIEPGKNAILLDSPIVRHKDRRSPAVGKELLADVNQGAIVYSYTEGPRPVLVEGRDRDLLANRDRVLAEGGPKAWAEFLEKEVAKRKAQRAAAAAAAKEAGAR